MKEKETEKICKNCKHWFKIHGENRCVNKENYKPGENMNTQTDEDDSCKTGFKLK